MTFKDYFQITIKNLATRRLRSWLTIIGVMIGIFLIIALTSLSQGLKTTIMQQLRALGGEMIFIMPGEEGNPFMAMMGGGFEKEDVETVEKTKGVEVILPMSYRNGVVKYRNEQKTAFLAGQPWEGGLEILQSFQGWSLNKGEWPEPGKRQVLLGKQIAEEFFEQDVRIGEDLIIKGMKLEITGILNSLGNKMDDSFVYMDMDLYKSITGEKKGTAQILMAKVEPGADVEKVAERIKDNLENTAKRRQGKSLSSFSVITSEKMGNLVGDIMVIIQLVIIGFASIAIIVGGIGIMNTMYTSVHDRIKEIGIMKAIGAKKSNIIMIFLMESGLIGLSGGIGGVALGVLLAKSVEWFGQVHPVLYLSASVSPSLIIFGLIFAFLIGCLAGFLPARKAAGLKPVDALRYE